MTSQAEVRALTQRYIEPWPPDDTEESVVGTNFHQTTITNIRWGINEAAHLYREAGADLPWEALSQIVFIGCRRPDDTSYHTLPDVFVYPHPIDPSRPSVVLAVDGPPILIVEVLSDSTYGSDLDIEAGKGYSYARAGVKEYLALDPTGVFVPDGGRAWRLTGARYEPWERGDDGRWWCETLPLAIGLEGAMAGVYTHTGRRLLREGEVEETIARHAEAIAKQAEEIKALRQRLQDLRQED